jgi:cytochrome c oxidase assembly protein subunit 15
VAADGDRRVRWLPAAAQTATALRRLAAASVLANVVIVVTGGAVRLTNSGLGCPTWPRCTDASLTPTKQYAIHGLIEFSNRMFTFVLVAIALATWIVAMIRRRERVLATVAALGIPAQAVLGGLTVLTHLNPWLVGAHFLLSMGILAVTFLLWWRVREVELAPRQPDLVRLLAAVTAAVVLITLVIGTIVTGAGPHAGDIAEDGTIHRNGLSVASMAQLHADVVMVLIGLTAGLVVLVYAVSAGAAVRRAAVVLLAVELAQGIIGYTQYFLHVPPLLVGLHMLGACLVWLAALHVLLRAGGVRRSAPAEIRTTA